MRARSCRGWAAVLLLTAGCTSPALPFNQRGVQLFNTGQYEAAQAEFLQATNQDPLNADAFYNLASTYHRLGQRSEAEWNYTHCLALDPNHSKCQHAMVVLLLEQGFTDEAYATVQRWITASPGSPDAIVELAWLEKQSGKTGQARDLLQQAIAIQPRHPRALVELASLYESSNQPDRALVLYERALAYNPDQPELSAKVADLRGSLPDRSRSPTIMATNPTTPRAARDVRYEFR